MDEILRLDDRQHLDRAVGLGGAARGEAQRDARFRAVVDHHQIGARHISFPLSAKTLRQARRAMQARGDLFSRPLDPACRFGVCARLNSHAGKRAMPTELKMPALSPTMEEGTLAKWLVKEGDTVKSGDLLAEIETDKATMEFEAVDEGTVIEDPGRRGHRRGQGRHRHRADRGRGRRAPTRRASRARAGREGARREEARARRRQPRAAAKRPPPRPLRSPRPRPTPATASRPRRSRAAWPKRRASTLPASTAPAPAAASSAPTSAAPLVAPRPRRAAAAPHRPPPPLRPSRSKPTSRTKRSSFSNMRKTIARRLTESKQQVPHIYLTVDIQLDALLKLRGELNASLAGARRQAQRQRHADQGARRWR